MCQPDPDSERYSRQVILPEIGISGQRKLARSSVLVVGAGGIGSTLLMALAGAGIGRITVCDSDIVCLNNLNRQFLYTPDDLDQAKLDISLDFLARFQPETSWQGIKGRMDLATARRECPDHDLVLAAVDNRETRVILNQACCETGRKFIDAGVAGFSGYVLPVLPGRTACYVCYSGDIAETADQELKQSAGITGAVAGVVGSLQACFAIRMLLDLEQPVAGKAYIFSGSRAILSQLSLQRADNCPACGNIKEMSG